jgi:alkanesulfonate monooxygenase SsuD/methylene tetrahydromethanopterin reductase-like flavin-dependent oxidoreductase (luciferase family)
MAEGHGGDAFAILTACAMKTRRILLGSSIVSVYVRSAPTIALGAAVVNQVSGGRFILGLGSSHRVQVEPEHGLAYSNPVGRMQETTRIVRGLLAKGKIDYTGAIYPKVLYDFWFTPLRKRVPIYFAAVLPKLLAVAGAMADGVILVWATADYARECTRIVRRAERKAGRKPGSVRMTALLPGCVWNDVEAAIDGARKQIAFYVGFFPRYYRLVHDGGFPKEADKVRDAWARGRKNEAVELVTEKMVRALTVTGGSDEVPRRLDEYRRAGLDVPILFPVAPPAGTVKEEVLAAIRAASA